jgi:putative PIN family toxin of toxin-antitoxin system
LTEKLERVVLDTNIVLSGILFKTSSPMLAMVRAFERGTVLSSSATRNELREVVQRNKFDRYISLRQRIEDIEDVLEEMEPVTIREKLQVCIDPKDDKFLELAVNGNADVIITGDDHLLRLHPFRGIAIFKPADYLAS